VSQARERGEDFKSVLIDYKMPDMSGIQTALQIRKLAGDVPVSLISAYDWNDIEEEAKAAGISSFIAKSLFKSTLFPALNGYGQEGASAQSEKKESERRMNLDGIRVLLAEDQPLNADIATTILEDAGAHVQHAEDGLIATKMFQESPLGFFDVFLMDLRMSNMDGIGATLAIRGMPRADALTVPIIALTADAFAEDAQRCMDAGMNAHMPTHRCRPADPYARTPELQSRDREGHVAQVWPSRRSSSQFVADNPLTALGMLCGSSQPSQFTTERLGTVARGKLPGTLGKTAGACACVAPLAGFGSAFAACLRHAGSTAAKRQTGEKGAAPKDRAPEMRLLDWRRRLASRCLPASRGAGSQ
jgi:CheY-like chemotaxis protein